MIEKLIKTKDSHTKRVWQLEFLVDNVVGGEFTPQPHADSRQAEDCGHQEADKGHPVEVVPLLLDHHAHPTQVGSLKAKGPLILGGLAPEGGGRAFAGGEDGEGEQADHVDQEVEGHALDGVDGPVVPDVEPLLLQILKNAIIRN